jgi:hypothetical protein
VTFVPVAAELADELRRGVAVERIWLRDGGEGELPELVVKAPERPPERLLGWSPVGRPARANPGRRPPFEQGAGDA